MQLIVTNLSLRELSENSDIIPENLDTIPKEKKKLFN